MGRVTDRRFLQIHSELVVNSYALLRVPTHSDTLFVSPTATCFRGGVWDAIGANVGAKGACLAHVEITHSSGFTVTRGKMDEQRLDAAISQPDSHLPPDD